MSRPVALLSLLVATLGCYIVGPDDAPDGFVTVTLEACLEGGSGCESPADPPTSVSVRLSDQRGQATALTFNRNNLARFHLAPGVYSVAIRYQGIVFCSDPELRVTRDDDEGMVRTITCPPFPYGVSE